MADSSGDTRSGVTETGSVRWSIAFAIAWVTMLGIATFRESRRWLTAESDPLAGWWSGRSPDWLPFLPLMILAIPLWFIRRPLLARLPRWWMRIRGWGGEACPTSVNSTTRREDARAVMLSLVVAAAGFLMSSHVGRQFGDLPPAYHDEFSYVFQAETFLAGRVSFPSHPEMPELFDQMHVLNEGTFASRYFPGVGAWIAPFLALGDPWLGHRVAHAFASFLLFWIGRHLGNNAVGLMAGLLLAVSPGVVLFSNLLLAHHPTIVGLLVFLITFLKFRRSMAESGRLRGWALLSGCGLTYAMLCRPMTAAGVGLPFGLWFGWWVLTGKGEPSHSAGHDNERFPFTQRLQTAAAMAMPVAISLIGLFFYNRAITGDGLVTPYEQYTDVYTPRHVYGFNNKTRGEARLGPKVIDNYDNWAENLTPALARSNTVRRTLFSLRWTLGIVPLGIAGIVFLLTIDRWSGDWWLIAAAILSLHAVHVPYWFVGIMNWHYVFESAPLLLLVFAGVTQQLWRTWEESNRRGLHIWWSGLIGMSVAVNLVTIEPLWPARLDVGIAEVSYPRHRYATFFNDVQKLTGGRRSLVLVEADPADRHVHYVVNSPSLDALILYGHFRPGGTDIEAVVRQFADRDVWLIRIAPGTVEQLSVTEG